MGRTTGQNRARYETALDRAHRNLYWAGVHAGENGDPAAEHECYVMMTKILEMMQDSLHGTRRRPPEGAKSIVRIRKPGGGDVVR